MFRENDFLCYFFNPAFLRFDHQTWRAWEKLVDENSYAWFGRDKESIQYQKYSEIKIILYHKDLKK